MRPSEPGRKTSTASEPSRGHIFFSQSTDDGATWSLLSTLEGMPGREGWNDPKNQPPGHLGLPAILEKAPRDKLVKFYKDFYRPDLMAVIAVGAGCAPPAASVDSTATAASGAKTIAAIPGAQAEWPDSLTTREVNR